MMHPKSIPIMRYFVLLGGSVGFALTIALGVLTGQEPSRILLNSGVGCLVGAYVMKVFWTVMARCVRNAHAEKARVAAATPPSR